MTKTNTHTPMMTRDGYVIKSWTLDKDFGLSFYQGMVLIEDYLGFTEFWNFEGVAHV